MKKYILIGLAVFITACAPKIDTVAEQKCVDSGGTYADSECSCALIEEFEYTFNEETAYCEDEFGLPGGIVGEQIKEEQELQMKETECVDEGGTFEDGECDLPEKPVVTILEGESVTFHSPVERDIAEAMEGHDEFFESKIPDYWKEQGLEAYMEHLSTINNAWKVGDFTGGQYEGQSLVRASASCDGMCPNLFFRFAVDEDTNTWILLTNHSNEMQEGYVLFEPDAEDGRTQIKELMVPDKLDIYDSSKVTLSNALQGPENYFPFDREETNAVEVELEGTNFTKTYRMSGCIYGILPDGMVARYRIMPESFVDPEYVAGSAVKNLTFESLEGEKSTRDWALTAGGCGFSVHSCLSTFKSTAEEEALLEKIGTLDGMDAFMLSEINEEAPDYKDQSKMLQRQVHNAYSSYQYHVKYSEDETEKMSIQEYVDARNVFFLKLNTGEYAMAYDAMYAPAVECGKPVIYLYPEEDTVVNVQVDVDEFTVTEPEYGADGWTVLAEPSGRLTNLEDDKVYSYLFWEGLSDETFELEPGFTLAMENVEDELPGVLESLGLNKQETADFMEFWLPRIQDEGTPYVEFTFVEQKLFDQIAPLTVTPAPDQVIRVFMVHQGVYESGLSVPKFHAPPRYGFTVVEWGGALQ